MMKTFLKLYIYSKNCQENNLAVKGLIVSHIHKLSQLQFEKNAKLLAIEKYLFLCAIQIYVYIFYMCLSFRRFDDEGQ